MVRHQLAGHQPQRSPTPSAYRAGNEGKQMGQGASPPQRTLLERAEHHCRRALALDPVLPEGHLARAFILWSPAKNFQHAESIAALEQVLAAQPNLERAHNSNSFICTAETSGARRRRQKPGFEKNREPYLLAGFTHNLR
jgi:hypothetical protein